MRALWSMRFSVSRPEQLSEPALPMWRQLAFLIRSVVSSMVDTEAL